MSSQTPSSGSCFFKYSMVFDFFLIDNPPFPMSLPSLVFDQGAPIKSYCKKFLKKTALKLPKSGIKTPFYEDDSRKY